MALALAQSRQSDVRSWRCAQPTAAEATASVAVVGKMPSILRAAAICHRMMHVAGRRDKERDKLICGEKQQQ